MVNLIEYTNTKRSVNAMIQAIFQNFNHFFLVNFINFCLFYLEFKLQIMIK